MYARYRNKKRMDCPEALAELERRHYETPQEMSVRIQEHVLGDLSEEVEMPEAPDLLEAEEVQQGLRESFLRPTHRYQKVPSESLATRNAPGDRARLAYAPAKKVPRGRRGTRQELDTRWARQRRNKRVSPKSARFSKTFDAGWRINRHEQITFHLDSHSTYDTLLGITFQSRRPEEKKSAAGKKKPDFYHQASHPFYYALDTQGEAFYQSWRHAVQAALVVKSHRQGVVWPDVEWQIGSKVELCRTPLPMAQVLLEDGTVQHSGPEGKHVYEVVELQCVRATQKSYVVCPNGLRDSRAALDEDDIEEDEDDENGDGAEATNSRVREYKAEQEKEDKAENRRSSSGWINGVVQVKSKSLYTEVPRYQIVIRRESLDGEGYRLPVSVLGNDTALRLDIDTTLRCAEQLPDWFEDVRGYLGGHRDQHDGAGRYFHHPLPAVQRWGFVQCESLRRGDVESAFFTEPEEALLHSPELYRDDSPRRDGDGYHPLYFARLAALAAGELLWREDWQVDDVTAWKDIASLQRLKRFTDAATTWVHVFCQAFVAVALLARKYSVTSPYRILRRRSLDGRRPLRFRFCRGPPVL